MFRGLLRSRDRVFLRLRHPRAAGLELAAGHSTGSVSSSIAASARSCCEGRIVPSHCRCVGSAPTHVSSGPASAGRMRSRRRKADIEGSTPRAALRRQIISTLSRHPRPRFVAPKWPVIDNTRTHLELDPQPPHRGRAHAARRDFATRAAPVVTNTAPLAVRLHCLRRPGWHCARRRLDIDGFRVNAADKAQRAPCEPSRAGRITTRRRRSRQFLAIQAASESRLRVIRALRGVQEEV